MLSGIFAQQRHDAASEKKFMVPSRSLFTVLVGHIGTDIELKRSVVSRLLACVSTVLTVCNAD